MKPNGIAGLLAASLMISAIMARAASIKMTPQSGIAFYVSTKGNDAWSGRFASPNVGRSDGPLRTVAAARDAIRRLRTKGPLDKPVFVYIRSGVYSLDQPLVFSPQDSGTPSSPVAYAAYPGETPVLSGGQQIRDWAPVADADASSEPAHDSAPDRRDAILKWRMELPEVKDRKWYFHQLFVNGQRRQRARTPNTGYFLADGDITPDDPARLRFNQGDIRTSWAQAGDVELVVLSTWEEYRMFIKAVDATTQVATLSTKRNPYGAEKNARYWVENAVDALDAPGEWYLDRTDGKLLYIPLPGEDIKLNAVMAPRLQQLVRFEGNEETGELVHDITLRDLAFSYTDWSIPPEGYVDMQAAYDIPAAVEMAGVTNCSIEKCLFTHLGQYAVEIHRGSKNVRIVGNEMTDLGAGGLKIGDPKIPNSHAEATEGNVVSDNHIHDIGIVYPAAVGIWIGQSSGNTIAHNEIDHTYYTGISVGWTWGYGPTAERDNVLESNHIHDIGRGMLSDMGCIYTLGVQPGTVERNNICHDVTRYENGYGGWGIYTDEGSSNILIENNLVYRAQDGGFHQHYGRENMVRNNIFAFGQTAQIRRTRQEPHRSFTFEHNIVYWKEGPLLEGKWDDGHFQLDSNLYFNFDGKQFQFGNWSFEEWQKRAQDEHSLITDPLFVDAEHDDFRLSAGSPALKVGFRMFEVGQVGPRKSSKQ
ncbi:MAG: right-handed parallel beta-helix repeat-containing protein [Terriglobia bacterium]